MICRRLFRRNFSSSARSAAFRILADEFRQRRARLVDSIAVSILEDGASSSSVSPLVFVSSQCQTFSAPDVPHVFRQCSNFRYLTGFEEVDSAQLLVDAKRSVLFVDERTPNITLWQGDGLDSETICRISGVDAVLPFAEFERYLASMVRADTILAADLARLRHDSHLNENVKNSAKLLRGIPSRFELLPHIDKLRWIKSTTEREIMRETCRIGAAVMNATIAGASEHTNEAELVGRLEFEARRRGAQFLAYPPVVAGGANANTIHYISSKQDINPADCVLVDAGCDVDGYVSDITRCFPISARFSGPQRELYDALSLLQDELLRYVDEIRPLCLNELYFYMLKRMGHILKSLKFFTKELSGDDLIIECDRLCPHHVSHYLGLDVHDSPTVPRNIPVQDGVVITVEPGIYVKADNEIVREEFRGLGFRIEDDILITKTGSENLTSGCVRRSDDIETLMESSLVSPSSQ